MAMTGQELNRTFFDLPTDESTQIETAELLADLAIGGRTGWSTLLESERVLIISEAGMGKTYECQRQQQSLWEEGRSTFFVELATLATDPLERQFSAEEQQRFDNWKAAQTERGFFFLDSVDELKLTQRSFETTLKQFAAALGDNLERACIVLTTRPTAFDLNVVRRWLPVQPPPDVFVPEDYFANVAMSVNKEKPVKRSTPEWRFVALSALDEKQMRALAAAPASMSRPRPSGTTRMMFSVRPPPVMWAMPWIAAPCSRSSDRIGLTYRRVGAISASTSFTPSSSTRSAGWPARS